MGIVHVMVLYNKSLLVDLLLPIKTIMRSCLNSITQSIDHLDFENVS